jgi:2-amino-4-hydroxy-6-hydroxymethyldihydropteridine diphosphokinase
MNYAYLILGGNIGNTLENLRKTRNLIDKTAGAITKVSDIFITAAWGNTEQPDFYNQAMKIETELSPVNLLENLLKIEEQLGRIRDGKKWAARTMDIDILFYNSETVNEPHLKIPHPFIQERKFVLAPLAQIAGDYIHPVIGKNIDTLLSECADTSEIKIVKN